MAYALIKHASAARQLPPAELIGSQYGCDWDRLVPLFSLRDESLLLDRPVAGEVWGGRISREITLSGVHSLYR